MKNIIFALLLLLFPLFGIGQEIEPTDTEAKLNVIVTDLKGNPTSGDIITLVGVESGKSYSGVTGSDGKFSILIPKGKKYKVKFRAWGDDDEYSELEVPAFDGKLNFDFTIKYELPKVYTLDNVYFDTGKSTLSPKSNKALNNLAELMLNKKTMKIEISGHTDNVGDDDFNMKLSQSRADAVKNYLVKKGVEDERVKAKGYGETKPVASNDTDQGKQKNRRTEVKILSK